jgi:acyl-CoA thioester hydrolase
MPPLENNAKRSIEMASDRFEQKYRVGWSGLDANHHMGNISYLDRAHDTRMFFFAQKGFTMARFAAERFGPVVVRDELVYRKELRLLDEFTVDFELAGISQDGVRFRVRNTFRNAKNEVAAAVTSEGVWFDLERRRPRAPPPELDELMRALRHTNDFEEIPAKNASGDGSREASPLKG